MTGEPYDGITLKDPVEERKINRNEPPSTNMKTRTRKTTSSTPDRGSMVSYPCSIFQNWANKVFFRDSVNLPHSLTFIE